MYLVWSEGVLVCQFSSRMTLLCLIREMRNEQERQTAKDQAWGCPCTNCILLQSYVESRRWDPSISQHYFISFIPMIIIYLLMCCWGSSSGPCCCSCWTHRATTCMSAVYVLSKWNACCNKIQTQNTYMRTHVVWFRVATAISMCACLKRFLPWIDLLHHQSCLNWVMKRFRNFEF